MGAETEIKTEEQRVRPDKSEVERLFADNSKARSLTGWRPGYGGLAGFRRGLEETVYWFSQEENRRFYKTGIYHI
jgi:nucleoside-diphosphate-sugar epimerase